MRSVYSKIGALALIGAVGVTVSADERRVLRAQLSGFQEPPAVVSTGSGRARVVIHDETLASYEFEFENLEGTVTQAHIHLGQPGVNGGIMVWLCGTETNPGPIGTPSCGGPTSGAAARALSAVDVIGPEGQGVSPGEFADFLLALRTGNAYANVHSTRNPGGEIRGQLRGDFRRH